MNLYRSRSLLQVVITKSLGAPSWKQRTIGRRHRRCKITSFGLRILECFCNLTLSIASSHQYFASFHSLLSERCHLEAHPRSGYCISTMSIALSLRNTIQLAVLLASRACATIIDKIRDIKGNRSSSRSSRETDSVRVWRAV